MAKTVIKTQNQEYDQCSSKMKFNNGRSLSCLKKLLECFIYAALVLTSAYFIGEMAKEYLVENTNFSIIEESITKEDLPTVTICISTGIEKKDNKEEPRTIRYGQDFTIQTMNTWFKPWLNPNATMKTLSEGDNFHDFMKQRRHIKLEEMRVFPTGYLFRFCVKMQFTISELFYRKHLADGTLFDLGMFSITLSENIIDNIQEATVYTTSETNSYGAVLGKWYNGKVKPIQLQRGEYTSIVTTKMTRYEYLENKCSQTSYYECLGEKIWQQKNCQLNGIQCQPISTPLKKIPVCQTNNSLFCLQSMLQAEQECVGLMPCITEEYTVGLDDAWTSRGSTKLTLMKAFIFNKVVEELLEEQHRKYYFWIDLTSDKTELHGYDKIQKIIHKEYLVWTGFGMVGNIGGQLGLWVGFSFTGLAAGIINLWYWACRKLSSNKHLGTGNQEKTV